MPYRYRAAISRLLAIAVLAFVAAVLYFGTCGRSAIGDMEKAFSKKVAVRPDLFGDGLRSGQQENSALWRIRRKVPIHKRRGRSMALHGVSRRHGRAFRACCGCDGF